MNYMSQNNSYLGIKKKKKKTMRSWKINIIHQKMLLFCILSHYKVL